MKNRGRRHASVATGEIVRTASLACLIAALLAGSVAVVSAARTIDISPRIGDILVFRPGMQVVSEWEFPAVTVSRELPLTCDLRPYVMAATGGSLVVEQRTDSNRMYRVHWAGPRTSDGPADCGTSADLMLSRPNLQLLTNVVGGAGVVRKGFGEF